MQRAAHAPGLALGVEAVRDLAGIGVQLEHLPQLGALLVERLDSGEIFLQERGGGFLPRRHSPLQFHDAKLLELERRNLGPRVQGRRPFRAGRKGSSRGGGSAGRQGAKGQEAAPIDAVASVCGHGR